ncbi:MAG: hypothetical protein EBR32_03880 [Bacteroidetes bacterium]|nr:hypothetical protein [Bacteroidota bacterium]
MSSFSTILFFEIKQWFRRPSYYIYLSVIFLLAMFSMASSTGIFDAIAVSVNSATLANSPSAINGLLNSMNVFIFFLLPALMGGTIYKDFKHEMHSVLFSYPFSKSSYLIGKFFAGYAATMGILLAAALGIMIGTFLPGTNPDLIAPFQLSSYVQSFWMYLIPNTFFLGAFVFAVVTFTRSISVGFLSVLGLIIVQSIADTLLTDLDNKILSALLDPFGYNANLIYTEYWTVYEQNENPLPWEQWVIVNRMIWSLVGASIFGLVFAKFQFHQQAIQIKWPWSKKGERLTKNNFGVIGKISLPKATLSFRASDTLRRLWVMGRKDLIYIISGWPFIIIVIMALLLSLITITTGSEIYGTQTLPVTWQMLELPGTFFGLFINLLTFLYAGMVLQRDHTTGMASLLHSTPIPTWMILGSKLLALSLMQLILLTAVMAMGIGIQSFQGYYQFELDLYLYQLFGIQFIHLFIWSLFALFIHTLFKNYFVGFFVLLLVSIGLSFSSQIGLEQLIFKFNQAPPTPYSDMNGYGHYLSAYFSYKIYWLALATALYILALWIYPRGSYPSWKERYSEAKKRILAPNLAAFTLSLVIFLSLGSYIYYVDNIKYERQSSKEQEASQAEWEKTYGKFKGIPQPRITASYVEMDIYPKQRNLAVTGRYTLVNKTDVFIDSIHVDHGSLVSEFSFSEPFERVLEDTVYNYDIFALMNPLAPGDSIGFEFSIYNKANEWLRNNSPVLANGTFLNNGILPRIGYNSAGELLGNESREKFGLAPRDRMPDATDSLARMNNYISYDADWIDFETIVSTSVDQIAIAPGYLEKEWIEDDRRYFHYKMDSPILNFYSFISAQFEVEEDYWLSLKVLEKRYGEDKMRIFLKDALDRYLTLRAFEGIKERPLMYNENQQYIHYNKGSLVLYALSDYLSEERLNSAIKNYVQKVAFQEAPYTIASEFVDEIEAVTPDSLTYLIDDLFRTITLYDNRVEKAEWWMTSDSLYEVELTLQTVKYQSDEKGKRIYTNADGDSLMLEKENLRRPLQSLPLRDYIDVGIFTKNSAGKDSVLYLQKHRFEDIETTLRLTLDHEPSEVGVDPYNKLFSGSLFRRFDAAFPF